LAIIAKLEWLRVAAREATDSIERGEGIEFGTMDDFAAYVHQMGKDVSGEVATKRKHG
jgi:hypothetical protein